MKRMFTGFILLIIIASSVIIGNAQTLSAFFATNEFGGNNSNSEVSIKPKDSFKQAVISPTYILEQSLEADLILVEKENESFDWFIGSEIKAIDNFYTISFETINTSGFVIEVYDLTGNKVYTESLAGSSKKYACNLYLSSLLKGVYILNVSSKEKTFNKNFKIQKK